MNKLFLAAVFAVFTASGSALQVFPSGGADPAAEALVAKCARAMGGRDLIGALKTLRVWAVFPGHGDRPLGNEIKRPNLSYNPQVQLAFDGKRACFLKGRDGKSMPEMIDQEEIVDFDVEIAYYFPAFFDYPSEYAGSRTVDGRRIETLRVNLPHGAIMSYDLDGETGLPIKINTRFQLRGKTIDVDRILSDYKVVGGILYPHGFTYQGRNGEIQHGRITSVEINPDVDPAHFVIPDGIGK